MVKEREGERPTGIHPERADTRCFEDLEVWLTEVTPARRQSRRLALEV